MVLVLLPPHRSVGLILVHWSLVTQLSWEKIKFVKIHHFVLTLRSLSLTDRQEDRQTPSHGLVIS
jgi:hypothetical protein